MIDSLVRSHIRTFTPYKSARSEVGDANVFLDANELSLGSAASYNGLSLNRYPDPFHRSLRKKLAARLSCPVDMIFSGVGSDEIIDLLIRLFCEPFSEAVVILEPTYGVYRVAADLNRVAAEPAELDDSFQIDLSATLNKVSPSTKLIFCCHPNNPTGNCLRRTDILSICRSFKGIVIVDEAYVEFAPEDASLVREVFKHENLIVLRTLSKAWGLAAIRLGYCIANPDVVSYLMKIKPPYNINAVSLDIALRGMDNEDFFESSRTVIREERSRLASGLRSHPHVTRVYPSDANFLLVEWKDAPQTYQLLFENGIIVRRRSEPRLSNCLRITVGTPEENGMLLKVLGRLR